MARQPPDLCSRRKSRGPEASGTQGPRLGPSPRARLPPPGDPALSPNLPFCETGEPPAAQPRSLGRAPVAQGREGGGPRAARSRGGVLLGPESLLGSSRCTDLGRGFRGLDLGFPRPCSSRICCCFRRRYSCLMSSRRAFSSSLRIRSSSALRLREGAARTPWSRQRRAAPRRGRGRQTRRPRRPRAVPARHPGHLPCLVSPELDLHLQLLPPHAGLLGFALLFQKEGCPLPGELVIRLLFVLQGRRHLQRGRARPPWVPSTAAPGPPRTPGT